jgi:hypothetical protein
LERLPLTNLSTKICLTTKNGGMYGKYRVGGKRRMRWVEEKKNEMGGGKWVWWPPF